MPAGRKPGTRSLSEKVIAAALKATDGMVYLAADKLGREVSGIYRRIQHSPMLQAIIEQAEGKMLDTSETALKSAILKGEAWAICFSLKCKGKHRGYIERVEHTGRDGAPLFDLKSMSDEDYATYKAIRARALALPGGDRPGGFETNGTSTNGVQH